MKETYNKIRTLRNYQPLILIDVDYFLILRDKGIVSVKVVLIFLLLAL